MASFLAFEDFNAEVRGLNSFPQDEIPDVRKVHFPFQAMVGIGFFLLFVSWGFWGLAWRRKRIAPGRWMLLAIAATAPMGFIAIEMGWYVTEFGRQPWIIWHLMRTSEAATPWDGIFFIFVVFFLVYIALAAGLALLLLRVTRQPLQAGSALQGLPDVT
jgi:cytochrome bd ubiquinol oxidase subunit I